LDTQECACIRKEDKEMGILSKEAYEGKREWAARKQARIAEECTALTPEQHEALAWLCERRHFFHCNMEDLFISESVEGQECFKLVDHQINDCLTEVGLPAIEFGVSALDFTDDSSWEYDGYASYEEAEEECMELAHELHSKMEGYLADIDREYGTEYAPTGATRI